MDQSRKTERNREARCGPQGKHSAGTPERSNPSRELVKRKQSSDCGRRIRKRVRQLTRASEGRHGAPAHRVNPTEVWNKVARRRKGSRMRRLAGGERSTRFESTSQYSQLPLQAEQSRKTEESQGARCGPQGKRPARTPERSNPNRELVKRKPSPDGGRISDAEAGWRGKIYPIRTRQPALPTSSHEDRGPSFKIDY